MKILSMEPAESILQECGDSQDSAEQLFPDPGRSVRLDELLYAFAPGQT